MTLRSDKVILVKNIQYNITEQNLKELFGFYGPIERLLLSPNKSIAIVEYEDIGDAEKAFSQVNLLEYKQQPLYLEYAPILFEAHPNQ